MSNLLFALVLVTVTPKPVALPSETTDQCFISHLCALKEAVRWRTPAWPANMCVRIGKAIIQKEKETGIPRNLILSIMINESDLYEGSQRWTFKKGTNIPVAWDGGLMGLRCRFGKDRRSCENYGGKLTYKDLLNPDTNITRAVAKLQSTKTYPCDHKDHPWFAHYNWGGKVFRTGIARSYPQRVAVLWKALADSQGVSQPELDGLKFVQVAGQRRVTINTPVGIRHRELVSKIWSSRCQTCGVLTLVPSPAVLANQ